jgi:hypothetical protein
MQLEKKRFEMDRRKLGLGVVTKGTNDGKG